MKTLTEKQKKVLKFIFDFSTQYNMPPTIEEIATHFHVKGPTVFAHLNALQRKNILTRSSKARSISFINKQTARKKIRSCS